MQTIELSVEADTTPCFDLLASCPDPATQKMVGLVRKSVRADINLVLGETGSGKELVARAIHELSRKRQRPFVTANCGSIPENLVESHFFGHERGSFTGAINMHMGVFERASGGTVFLDEIGEMPIEMQPRLLRVLQGHPFTRIGGTEEIIPACRVIAATNCDLEKKIATKEFREDLFYRLNVFPLSVPPLRDRPADIMHLARYFSKKYSRGTISLAPECEHILRDRAWKGNVRELENLIRRVMIAMEDDSTVMRALHFAPYMSEYTPSSPEAPEANADELAKIALHLLGLVEKYGGWNNLSEALLAEVIRKLSSQHGGDLGDAEIERRLKVYRKKIRGIRRGLS